MSREGSKKKPRLTVLVLIYNDARLGTQAIESVLRQSFADLQLLILDNGSTDDTPSIIKKYSADPRVEIITNPVNQRSEFAVRVARTVETEFLSFLFSDDSYHEDRIEKMLSLLDQNPQVAAVFSNNKFVDEYGREVKSVPPTQFAGDVASLSNEQHLEHMFAKGNSLHPCAMMIRTQCYLELGGFKPFLHRLGDMNFFARILCEKQVLFMKEKTQSITLWSSERNESAAGNIDWNALAYERILLLETFRSKNFLAKAEKVFPQITGQLSREADVNEKLFWMGFVAFLVPALDYKLFAMKCFFDAYEANPTQIDELCQRHYNQSFAQLLTFIQQGGLGEKRPRFQNLKRVLKRNKFFRPILKFAAKLR